MKHTFVALTESLLEDTEGVEEWGQNEPLTRRIKNLLKDYTDGFSVPKEIVQNADDAGATKVCFMYDERQNKE
jgi:sacsin